MLRGPGPSGPPPGRKRGGRGWSTGRAWSSTPGRKLPGRSRGLGRGQGGPAGVRRGQPWCMSRDRLGLGLADPPGPPALAQPSVNSGRHADTWRFPNPRVRRHEGRYRREVTLLSLAWGSQRSRPRPRVPQSRAPASAGRPGSWAKPLPAGEGSGAVPALLEDQPWPLLGGRPALPLRQGWPDRSGAGAPSKLLRGRSVPSPGVLVSVRKGGGCPAREAGGLYPVSLLWKWKWK